MKSLPLGRCRFCKPNSFSALFSIGSTRSRKITRRRNINTSCARKVAFAWHDHVRLSTQAVLCRYGILCIVLSVSVGWISLCTHVSRGWHGSRMLTTIHSIALLELLLRQCTEDTSSIAKAGTGMMQEWQLHQHKQNESRSIRS